MPIHLRAEPSDYAPAVLVPGDPKRARYIAEHHFDPGARLVNDERGMLGFTGTYRGKPISVQSVGMGGASVGIYYTELTQMLGATRLVRVGTAGGLRPGLRMGDTVVAMSATGDDPMVALLTDGEAHAPTATWSLVELAARLGAERGVRTHVGPIVTSAIFYDRREGIMARWRDRGHLAVEMEAAVLYTLAAIHGFEALAVMTISDLIASETDTERISDEELQRGVDQMMQIACDVAVSD
ncbi:MAG: purine-nucleoside phosphorylase [Ilumatobacteraceae bacterium]